MLASAHSPSGSPGSSLTNGVEWGAVGPPYWSDKPVLIVGAGPSLKGFDFNRLRGLGYVLAVKETWVDLPFADACFGLDVPWIIRQYGALCDVAQRMQLYVSVSHNERRPWRPIPRATHLIFDRNKVVGFSTDPARIESGAHSGYGAVNLAILKRARAIFLFGFDYTSTYDHYCPERYAHNKSREKQSHYFLNWAQEFNKTTEQIKRLGIALINASPNSNLKAYPKLSIDDAIKRLDRFRSERDGGVRGGA